MTLPEDTHVLEPARARVADAEVLDLGSTALRAYLEVHASVAESMSRLAAGGRFSDTDRVRLRAALDELDQARRTHLGRVLPCQAALR